MSLASASVLKLNSSFEPLDVVSLKRAVQLLLAGKAEVIHASDLPLRSEVISFRIPTIIRMLYYIKTPRKNVQLNKKNLLLRDDYRCGYCLKSGGSEMTVDHVVPKSRGGPSTWENLVACCMPCNQRKRNRTPVEAGMPLKRKPHRPHYIPWVVVRRHTLPDEWGKYLSIYNVGIEERVG